MRIVIACILLAFSIPLLGGGGLFDALKDRAELKSDEYLLIYFVQPGNCVKCYIEPDNIINYFKKNDKKKKIKYLAMVRCDREIELKAYKRTSGWKDYAYVNDGKAAKTMGAGTKTMIIIKDYSGNTVAAFNTKESKENQEKAIKLIEKLN